MIEVLRTNAAPLLLKTSDAGDTWVIPTGIDELETAVDASPNFANGKLFTGFALDNTHLWVGGDNATVYYSDTGAE